MFDSVELRYSVRDDEDSSANAALIARAQVVMISFGGRMLCALRRLAGDHGAALGDALRTMIMSREIAPSQWPLREAVEWHGRIRRRTGKSSASCARSRS